MFEFKKISLWYQIINSAAIQLLRKMEEGARKTDVVVYNKIIDSLCEDALGNL